MAGEPGVTSMCLTETRCFDLFLPDVDDFDANQLGVYHFEAVGLARTEVDRFELVQTIASDLSPTCLQVAFDGEPVHCRKNDSGSDSIWDESTLTECTTCNDDVITLGPIMGMAKAENTRIWVRTDATRSVELHLGYISSDMHLVAWAYPRVADDFTAEFVLEDLVPSTDYVYQLKVDGEVVGDVYSFTTAPLDESPVDLEFTFFSCARNDSQPAFEAIADGNPDLIAFLGDSHYGNTGDKGSLQWNYRWAHSRAHRRELMQVTPTLAIWDDHDYLGNNTDGSTPGKVAARMVFEDYWPNPAHGTEDLPGVFFSTSFGDVDFFFLDGRYYRGDNNNLIGDSQMMWLMEELLASTATFKLIVGGSQWSFESSVDSWAAFPEARTRLFDFIADQAIDGVALLSGDVHYSEVRKIDHEGLYSIPEFTSSGVAANHLPCRESESEQVICYDDDQSYMTLSINTMSSTPFIAASIHNKHGTIVGEHTVWLAELQPG
jgi:alkaline phosphatase D